MKTGAEIVLEWFRKYSEQNGTPTPFEIRCQLELAIEHDKTELKKLRVADVIKNKVAVCELKGIGFCQHEEKDGKCNFEDNCINKQTVLYR